jgi:uncharacterized protein YbjT (DUF2867 family)
MDTIMVTGASGNVGRWCGRAARGARVRVGSPTGRRPARLGRRAESRHSTSPPGNYTALDGVARLFLMRPPALSNIKRDIQPAIDRAVAAGVGHIVFLSLIGAERNRIVPHAKVERLLQRSGVAWTMLRCGFFMQNLDTTHRADIVEHDDIFIPPGRGARRSSTCATSAKWRRGR